MDFNDNKNTILLITTKGCCGCIVARRNIHEAILGTNKDINFVVQDVSEIDKKFITHNRIKDFPTVVFMNYNAVRFKVTGSLPAVGYSRYIYLYMK